MKFIVQNTTAKQITLTLSHVSCFVLLLLLLLLLILKWHYSPVQTFTSMMDFSQSVQFLTSLCRYISAFINICLYGVHQPLPNPLLTEEYCKCRIEG
jgi:uncharacterized membrane protein